MRNLFLLVVFNGCISYLNAQKPIIDTSAFGKWPALGAAVISNDGKFALYNIENLPVGGRTLNIKSINAPANISFQGASDAVFTQDSKYAIFKKSRDSLVVLNLNGYTQRVITNVSSFQLSKKGLSEWLAYQLNSVNKELIVENMVSGKVQSFSFVSNYLFSGDGKTLLLQTETKNDTITTQTLKWITMDEWNINTIWQSSTASANNFVFSADNTQLAYHAQEVINGQTIHSIWSYKAGTTKGVMIGDDHSAGIASDLRVGSIRGFSQDGTRLFFNLKERERPKATADAVMVDLWSFTDTKLQSQQLAEIDPSNFMANKISRNFLSVIDLNTRKILQLIKENETPDSDEKQHDVILITQQEGDASTTEYNWNRAAVTHTWLLSTKDGKRNLVHNAEYGGAGRMLLGRTYLVYYDTAQKQYVSYHLKTGVTCTITKSISVALVADEQVLNDPLSLLSIGMAGWLNDETAVLIYDQYDIWKVDPSGKQPAINVTNGYGRKHKLIFRLAARNNAGYIMANGNTFLLKAFDPLTKANWFYRKILNKQGDPELLTMGNYIYSTPDIVFEPLKARDANTWLVQRMSANEFPNYFVTTDFKNFVPISNVHPEKEYNWLTAELVNWTTLDGTPSQGILYKPENFDVAKKYPIIFYYYQTFSDELHLYREPGDTRDRINIPYFVSNGYLVFALDIHYTIGKTGESALNAIVSAAQYFSQKPWVDAKKMGLQGHSFGGYETNYVVTHSHLFAAACSASGWSNFVTDYWLVMGIQEFVKGPFSGLSRHAGYETGHEVIRATLWQRPDLFINNSPIFQAHRVTTPILLMNNRFDSQISFTHGIEFFTALRRQGKKAWMLQYDMADHSVLFDNDAKDFTIRVTQFFDHYLKDAPAPVWMTRGIPAKRKGIDSGYEFDTEIKTPGEGLLTPEAKKKVEAVMKRKPISVSIE